MPAPARSERGRTPRLVTVEAVERLSAGIIRIVFGGDSLATFTAGEFTDHYVKVHFAPPGAPYAPPFDPVAVRDGLPRELWPRTRTYTVRDWDAQTQRLTIDFVVHGDEGIAGPWAAKAAVGDLLQLTGPGGAYAPDPGLSCHVFIGDESALPAIAASLERIGPGRVARVVAQVPGPAHELALLCPGELSVQWLHGEDPESVLDAVRALDFPAGAAQVFLHGEATLVRMLRRHVLAERGVPRERLSASGYWKRHRTEDGWREDKPEWNRQVEEDLAA